MFPRSSWFLGGRQFTSASAVKLTGRNIPSSGSPTSAAGLNCANCFGGCPTCQLYADGGVGKTALAVELGWRLFEARQFDFVLFLNASTPETLDAELASLCSSDALDLMEQTAKEQEIRRAGAIRYLSTAENGR
jgi:hypothetical protein